MGRVFAVALCCFSFSAAASNRRALIVGINQYVPAGKQPPKNRGGNWNLEGAVSDALAIQKVLLQHLQFSGSEIHVVLDQNATRERILKELTEFLGTGGPGDVRLFYFAGHGSQVPNSLSEEDDRLDETIVPADAWGYHGLPDIRDKQLAEAFNRILDKHIELTVILDSCHSGSGARGYHKGRQRAIPPATEDAKDASRWQRPESRGALILSASQEYQPAEETRDENSRPRGAFTLALEEALLSVPADESIERVFKRARAIMQRDDLQQDPVLGSTPERRTRSLLGAVPSGTQASAIAVRRVMGSGLVEIDGGIASGYGVGTELVTAGNIRLKITKLVDLGQSEAQVIQGSLAALHGGDLVTVDKWVAPDQVSLRVWIPPSLKEPDIQAAAKRFGELAESKEVALIDDPAAIAPSHVISWSGEHWTLTAPGGEVSEIDKEKTLQLIERIRGSWRKAPICPDVPVPDETGPTVFLALPPTTAVGALHFENGGAIVASRSAAGAHYLLVGRRRSEHLEYGWLQAGVGRCELARAPAMPVSTRWVLADSSVTATLLDLAGRLSKIRGWLQLPSPPVDYQLHYHLTLRNHASGKSTIEGTIRDGEKYDFVLRRDAKPGPVGEERFVYVFDIDACGKGTLLFPRDGDLDNRIVGGPGAPAEKLLREGGFTVRGPFGVDHFILLTTSERLHDPFVLDFDGVDRSPRGAVTPLERLLEHVGMRGPKDGPTNWSIERLVIKSQP